MNENGGPLGRVVRTVVLPGGKPEQDEFDVMRARLGEQRVEEREIELAFDGFDPFPGDGYRECIGFEATPATPLAAWPARHSSCSPARGTRYGAPSTMSAVRPLRVTSSGAGAALSDHRHQAPQPGRYDRIRIELSPQDFRPRILLNQRQSCSAFWLRRRLAPAHPNEAHIEGPRMKHLSSARSLALVILLAANAASAEAPVRRKCSTSARASRTGSSRAWMPRTSRISRKNPRPSKLGTGRLLGQHDTFRGCQRREKIPQRHSRPGSRQRVDTGPPPLSR